MIAVAAMSVGWKAVLYLVVLALFLLAALASWPSRVSPPPPRTRLAPYAMVFLSLGFAVSAFVLFWTYWSLS